MTKHTYKVLVIDIDGTLINGQGRISVEDRQALAAARDAGMRVCLSTGRALRECQKIIKRLPLDSHHIFFDGALVSTADLSEEVYAQPISKETLRQMVEFAHENEMNLELFSTTQYFAERETWSTEAHRQFFDFAPDIVDFDGLCDSERIIKAGLVTTTPEEEAKAGLFKRHFTERVHFSEARTPAYPGTVFANILAPKVSKGKALEALVRHLGVSLDEVVAVGDGSNDIPLLSAAGLAVAMGNAHDEVKKVADYVTLDVDHSGLAAAIKEFLL